MYTLLLKSINLNMITLQVSGDGCLAVKKLSVNLLYKQGEIFFLLNPKDRYVLIDKYMSDFDIN